MIVRKSYTRITLALDIIRRITAGDLRGYHEMRIIKHQIDLFDLIRVEPAARMEIVCDDPRVPLDQTNICWRAVALLQKEFGVSDNVRIGIEKRIPVQGGLAGGSTNAAAVLSILNELWGLGLSRAALADYGRRLGMDVPYYFWGATALDSEATGSITPIAAKVCLGCILCFPGFGVSTAAAYQGIDYSRIARQTEKTQRLRTALETGNLAAVFENLHNDFEYSVIRAHPPLARLRETLLQLGCRASLLSGSGSTMIGFTETVEQARQIHKKLACPGLVAATLD